MGRDKEKLFKIMFDDGERGWAESLPNGQARIDIIPLTDRLNIDDVVTVSIFDGRPFATKVVSRAFPRKSLVRYPKPFRKTYRLLKEAWAAAGMKCEGMVEGVALVAHHADQDPVAVARTIGIVCSQQMQALKPVDPSNQD